MQITHEDSMNLYWRMVHNSPPHPNVQPKPGHHDPYKTDGKNKVTIVRAPDRQAGILEAIRLLGGFKPLLDGADGEIIIKPNCNTDNVYPRDSHPDTVTAIAEQLIKAGADPSRIVVGDMSGRARGLPTRTTIKNLGITDAAERLGIQAAYFDEEPWVRVQTGSDYWPEGVTIPQRIHEASRVIFTPIMRSHPTATFTCALKLGVGLLDARAREWLHNEEWHYEKLAEMNLAYNVDMVVTDVTTFNKGLRTTPEDDVNAGLIIASNNMAANDAVATAIMHMYGTARVADIPTREHKQLKLAESLGVGETSLNRIDLTARDLVGDDQFKETVAYIRAQLK